MTDSELLSPKQASSSADPNLSSSHANRSSEQVDGWSAIPRAILTLSFWTKTWIALLNWCKSLSRHLSLSQIDATISERKISRDLVIMGAQVEKHAKSITTALLKDQEISYAIASAKQDSEIIKWLSDVFAENLLSKINLASPINQDTDNEVNVNPDDGSGSVSESEVLKVCQSICIICESNDKVIGSGFIAYVTLDQYGPCMVLVTNNHVLKEESAKSNRIRLYDHYNTFELKELLKGDSFFKYSSDKELDYVFMELDYDQLKSHDQDIEPININAATIKDEDVIRIFQHPGGRLNVHVSSSRCYVYDAYVVYESETEHGSSGSPILKEVDGRLELVGLHRAGQEQLHQENNEPKPIFNIGSLFSEILHDLNNKKLQPRSPNKIKVEFAKNIHEYHRKIYGDYKPAVVMKDYNDSNISVKAGQEVLVKETTDEENALVYLGGKTITMPIRYLK